jgi:ferredoxin-NADP reductase
MVGDRCAGVPSARAPETDPRGEGDLAPRPHRCRLGQGPDDLYYADELPGPEATIVYTCRAPANADRPVGRIGPSDLEPVILSDATAYVCGSAGFADAASHLLVDQRVPVERIRVERFGPTG